MYFLYREMFILTSTVLITNFQQSLMLSTAPDNKTKKSLPILATPKKFQCNSQTQKKSLRQKNLLTPPSPTPHMSCQSLVGPLARMYRTNYTVQRANQNVSIYTCSCTLYSRPYPSVLNMSLTKFWMISKYLTNMFMFCFHFCLLSNQIEKNFHK